MLPNPWVPLEVVLSSIWPCLPKMLLLLLLLTHFHAVVVGVLALVFPQSERVDVESMVGVLEI